MWKPNLREHEYFAKLPEPIQERVRRADSGTHAAWILLSHLSDIADDRLVERTTYNHLLRKIEHGCIDALCSECDKDKS